MAGRAAPTAIAPSRARWCRHCRRRESTRSGAPAVTDRIALVQAARLPAARQRPRPASEKCGGEVLWRSFPQTFAVEHHATMFECSAWLREPRALSVPLRNGRGLHHVFHHVFTDLKAHLSADAG